MAVGGDDDGRGGVCWSISRWFRAEFDGCCCRRWCPVLASWIICVLAYLWVIRHNGNRQRSYQRKHTSSRPITEVKCVRAQIVLGWGTAWEHWVTLASLNFLLLPCPGGRRQQDGWGTTHMLVFLYCDSSFCCRAGADRGNGVSLDFCWRAVSWSTLM